MPGLDMRAGLVISRIALAFGVLDGLQARAVDVEEIDEIANYVHGKAPG